MRAPPLRQGTLLLELALTCALVGIVAAIAVPNVRAIRDRYGVRSARQDVVLGLWAARRAATMRGTNASFIVDARTARVRVLADSDTVFSRDLATLHGVTVSVTRDSVTYGPTGLGYGAANTRIVVARGGRADTITTSRLGRVSF